MSNSLLIVETSAHVGRFERLGATLEGTMRHHMIMRDGYIRDSLLYSVLDTEWPRVKQELAIRTFRS